MFDRILTVNYNNSKDSFLHLFSKQIKTGSCVQLTYGDNRIAYFSVSVSTVKLSDDCVSLTSLYARSLGIAENELVRITEISNLPTVTRISITPVNTNEYEILELLAENVQSTLLDQIRVINAGQKFVVWLASNINVAVYVEDVIPTTPGMIDFLTEVVVKPKSDVTVAVNDNSAVFNINKLKSLTSNLHEHKTNKNLQKFTKFKPNLICRIIPARKLAFVDEIEGHCKDFNAFVSKETIPKSWFCNNSIIICRVKLLTVDLLSEKVVFVRLCILDDLLGESCSNLKDNLFVSSTIFQHFNSPFGHRAILTFVDENPVVHEIVINTKKNYLVNVEETFKLYLTKNFHDVTVLSADVALDMGHYVKCSLKFMPDEAKFCVVDSDLLRNYKFQIIEGAMVQSDDKTCVTSKRVFLEEISNFQDITRRILNVFSSKGSRWENVLIIGRPGTGKSSLLKILADKLNLHPNFIFTRTIQCKAIKGKTLDSLYKLLSSALSELVLCQPSVLFFDDFHLLCECVNGDEAAPNAVHFNRISEMMHTYLKMCCQYNRIGICATTESTSKLNKNVYSSRGSHLFKNLFSIDDLSKDDRLNFFKYFFQKFTISDIDFDYFSIKTEGFVVQDLTDFCNKSVFEACKDGCDVENVTINEDHCEIALTKTCVLSLQNVKLHSPGSKTFSEIGGLHDVKKVLIESLMWPAQYPDIFAKAPLRLQSGLLLYGPPGTGKTLLAGAAAHCGLRLISIKGPELLSKYIGASEQAVRDVFQKAQSARPCILFFDEFDSLAPRRGHDNTGVTDRVVNQLLTQLDGVESLSGVCVLAATSRPDLLDPALLRPGRLDRQVLCPLPSKDDRLEILSLLSKNLDFAEDVDLKSIASATEGYSGADLQSILYTAQLSTIDDLLLDDSKEPLIKSQITQSHLQEALNKTRPSLSEQERLRYEKIYSKFQGGGPIEDFRAGSKATLA